MSILFVCLGNTCRSPMAEAIMRDLCEELELSWVIDSAGLRSWNVGRRPDGRCLKVLEENGLSTKHYGRMVNLDDFRNFDYIVCMDETNASELQVMSEMVGRKCKARIEQLTSYLHNDGEEMIKDPFFTRGLNGFRCTFNQISRCCRIFIKQVQHRENHGFTCVFFWSVSWAYFMVFSTNRLRVFRPAWDYGSFKFLTLGLSWIIDSAALRSWNVGRCPDERCLKVFEENHLSTEHYTRMLNWSDFQNFDYIICMDESNVNELKAMSQMVGETCKAQIQHLALYLFHKGERTIKDPFCVNSKYATLGLNGFRRTFDQISCCCRRLSIVIYYSEHHGFRLIWNNIWKYLSLPTPTFLNPVPETKSTAL
uniref:Phosphotyrosine protein phosphatase I domain-containing protein n=1 Tax=Glossina austeni TaxID=7395 RepID=A0A1A9V8W2_GLOAU